MRISDWSSDVCSSDLRLGEPGAAGALRRGPAARARRRRKLPPHARGRRDADLGRRSSAAEALLQTVPSATLARVPPGILAPAPDQRRIRKSAGLGDLSLPGESEHIDETAACLARTIHALRGTPAPPFTKI